MATEKRTEIAAAIADLGLSVDAAFVPFSRSRNKDEKHKSLNWRITLKRKGRDVLTTDYSAGIAHCPSYGPKAWHKSDAETECETGNTHRAPGGIGSKKPILPDPISVIWSLVADASVLDAGGFENWAADYGYDTDSRSAEKTYQACLDIALKLRCAIGEAGLSKLAEAFADY